MRTISPEVLPGRDKAALRRFLETCRAEARAKGRFQIASISLAVRHIAPLAVLESIYEPEELHFYVERPAEESALAGADAVVSARFSGEDRFARVRAFADEILDNTLAVGDLEAPFSGPHFFSAFAFADRVGEDAVFAAATVFLPRWQVSRSGDRYGAVANVRVDPDADPDALVERVWRAYGRFSSFDYAVSPDESGNRVTPSVEERGEFPDRGYADRVAEALREIGAGDYEKIVLARGLCLRADRPWQPLHALNRLRERFGGCFTFSFGGGGGCSFIGASPERLLSVRDGELRTEAIAGSVARGSTAAEDAALAGALFGSDKDRREHEAVRASILRGLRRAGVEAEAGKEPRLLPLANVQHLHTPIRATVGHDVHLLDIAAELHPTPAVGGTPRAAALPRIPELEAMSRGLYAGLVGWFNHRNEGELVVGIRSALIDGCEARLYAGAGVVAGSDPETENRETELKLRALLDALTDGGSPGAAP